MTREESVKQLNDLLDYCKSSGEEWAKDTEALEIAIKALEQMEVIEAIINSLIYIQEDVLRYKMICEVVKK